MKKYLSIILGAVAGIFFCGAVVAYLPDPIAYGDIKYEDFERVFIAGNDLSWSAVFGPARNGQDLYNLMLDKHTLDAKNDTLKIVAQRYGLTIAEAEKVLEGSIIPIFNTDKSGSGLYTKTRAYEIQAQLQSDYNEFYEQLQLAQEMDAILTPSEIFSNGDLWDSGFDLIHDLNVIEEILFLAKTPVSTGTPFHNSLSSPYLPTDADYQQEDFVTSLTDTAVLRSPVATDAVALTPLSPSGTGTGGAGGVADGIGYTGDEFCPSESALKDALGDYEEKALQEQEAEDSLGDPAFGDEGDEQGVEGGAIPDAGLQQAQDYELVSDGNINPASRGSWGRAWCPALNNNPERSAGDNFQTVVGTEGFKSLSPSNLVKNAMDGSLGSTGAGVAVELPGLEMHIGVCLEVEVVWQTVSSYLPGQTCIQCEIEKINELMEKTLSHSLVPNKVTGNLLESAKCKKSYQLSNALDMQIITIAAPIATPPNDDLIFGSNIWKEWNDFIEKYRPFTSEAGKVDEKHTQEFELANLPSGYSKSTAIQDINRTKAERTAEALGEIDIQETTLKGATVKNYSQALYTEMQQTTAFFKNFNKIFNDININACQALKAKSNEQ